MKKNMIILMIIAILMLGGCNPTKESKLRLSNSTYDDASIELDVWNYLVAPEDSGMGYRTTKSIDEMLTAAQKKYPLAILTNLDVDTYIFEYNKMQYFFREKELQESRNTLFSHKIIISNMNFTLQEKLPNGNIEKSRQIYFPLYYMKDVPSSAFLDTDIDIELIIDSAKVIEFYRNCACYEIVSEVNNTINLKEKGYNKPLILTFRLTEGITYVNITVGN